jgi:ubiquinone biosynthesis protein
MNNDHSQRKLKPPLKATSRFVVAYITTFFVLLSYLWLGYRNRVFGLSDYDKRLSALHKKNAKRIEHTILRLQGLFIKVGQLFSIMTNFLPEEFRNGLKNLQDAVPSRPYEQIERRIREELGREPLELFASIKETPIASASLGQVHRATMRDGRQVAVKVQHIGVEAMSHSDLKTIKRIVKIIGLFLKVRGMENFYSEIRSMILEELDFELEANHIEEIARHFIGNEKIIFPRVISEMSTSRVLTLDYVEGIKVTDRETLIEAGVDPSQVASDLVTAYCQMMFVDGVYHADPHPGNILVQSDGKIVFLDFGAIGHLSPVMRQGISSFLESIIKADENQLLQSLRTMGFLQTGSDESEAASRVIEHFHRKFQEEIKIDNFNMASVKMDTRRGLEALADLGHMNVGFRELSSAFHVPRQWVLLERTGLLLAGICTELDPDMKPADIIRPYLEEFVLGKDRDWSEMLFDMAREKVFAFMSLPGQIEKAITRTLAGRVSMRVEDIPPGVERLVATGHQLICCFFSIAASGIGLYFYDRGNLEIAQYAGYVVGGFGGLLLLSIIRARRFKKRR